MKTSDPQVVVTMADRKSGNLISIAGDVRNPFLVPVSLVGTKLIAAIAAADGSLSDAVAASGGPSDMQANPATIFVCRQ